MGRRYGRNTVYGVEMSTPNANEVRRWITVAATSVALASAAVFTPGPASARPEDPPPPIQGAVANPDVALGEGWQSSSDILVTGVGDSNGFHLYLARERDAFAWKTLATLNAGRGEMGSWTGYTCVTGSGRYAVAVYAPSSAVNRPALIAAGALAAVVDLNSGKARRVATGVQLAYFNPACGPSDRVLLTRSVDVEQRKTDLIAVDAAAGKAISTRRIKAQLTTPVPAIDGDYGVVRGALVRIDKSGNLTTVAKPGGQPYAVGATAHGAMDLLTVQRLGNEERAVAYRIANKKLARIGEAPRSGLDLFGLAGGRNAIVGEIGGLSASKLQDVSTVASDRKVRAVSREGHLLVLETVTKQVKESVTVGGAPAQQANVGQMRVAVRPSRSPKVAVGTVTTERMAAADAQPSGTVSTMLTRQDPGNPSCAVPRNDVHRQVLQPSANQVEWAVDLAVQGRLTIQRPTNYLRTGMQAYTPQGMFPLPAGSPRVPAQLMLAILAQESNLAQASWHAVPGDSGNPLVSDYYGTREWGDDIWYINYGAADCGYGIAQVTDGMRADSTTRTQAQKVAIATDYAANIAAGLQILVEKWNQTRATGTYVNNGDPAYIENWFMAVWGYNSGVYQNTGSGNYGVGWLNNPANPTYPANRQPFLRESLDDASHPADWPYPEKIMGWAETPQWQWIDPLVKYAEPNFGSASGEHLSLPGRYQFCGGPNACNPNQPADPCPNWDSTCWWHGYTSWVEDCLTECGTEKLTYGAGSGEPNLIRVYPKSCSPFGTFPITQVVDDLADSANNILGCPAQPWAGKFTIRTGSPPGSAYAEYGQVDLHQLGAGYLGHSWFTHAYSAGGDEEQLQKVVGTWTPNISDEHPYEILVHLTSHGSNYSQAEYIIKPNGPVYVEFPCTINQNISNGQDKWVYLGYYDLYPGARVQLSNIVSNADGSVDVGYDAMAFNLVNSVPAHSCGDAYTG
jgi:hypothetical protein